MPHFVNPFVIECFECCTSALRANASDPVVAEWGCAALIALSKGNAGRANNVKLGQASACQAVSLALIEHNKLCNVAMLAADAISNIAASPANKSAFGSAGALEALLNALEKHMDNVEACKLLVKACGILSYQHNKNTNRLISNGGDGHSLHICLSIYRYMLCFTTICIQAAT